MIDSEKLVKEFNEIGITTLERGVDLNDLAEVRSQILDLIEEAAEKKINKSISAEDFPLESAKYLWEIFNNEPEKRNTFFAMMNRLPALAGFANHPVLLESAKALGLKKPQVIENSMHMYLPWEKCFFQGCHQDINSMKTDLAVTFYIPIHDITEEMALRYWPKTHHGGPIKHIEENDLEYGHYGVVIPEEIHSQYPKELATWNLGDISVFHRLLFHASPQFDDQKVARWVQVIRYDDFEGQGLRNEKKFQGYTPFPDQRYRDEIIPGIKKFLSEKPKVNWSASA